MADEIRRVTESRYASLLELFQEIHAHSQEVEAPVESADDVTDRTIGFCVGVEGVKVHWKIPLTRLVRCWGFPENEEAWQQLSRLFPTTEGRARLAQMLTEGTFPGA